MSTATLSSKFQLSVPKALREAMHLQPGQQFEMIPAGPVIQLVPKTAIQELRGIARGERQLTKLTRGQLRNSFFKQEASNRIVLVEEDT